MVWKTLQIIHSRPIALPSRAVMLDFNGVTVDFRFVIFDFKDFLSVYQVMS